MKDNVPNQLRNEFFVEPVSPKLRVSLVNYVKEKVSLAKKLSRDDLLGSEGHKLAMDIAGALAFHSSGDVKGSWLTNEREPALFHVLAIAGKLDANSADDQAWRDLFTEVDEL